MIYNLMLGLLRFKSVILTCLLFTGCEGTFQSGNYVVTTDSWKATDTGIDIELLGNAASSRAPEATLLKIAVKLDLQKPYEGLHSANHEGNVSAVEHTFVNQDGKLVLNIEWDRRTLVCIVNGKSIPFKIGEDLSVELRRDGTIR
jgi:hypothetical protein